MLRPKRESLKVKVRNFASLKWQTPNKTEQNLEYDDSQPWKVRLSGGLTPVDGRVEVRRGSKDFGLVCDIGWTINEGNVVCRQLGYTLVVKLKMIMLCKKK